VAILRRGEPVRLEDESPPKMRARSREFVIFLSSRAAENWVREFLLERQDSITTFALSRQA